MCVFKYVFISTLYMGGGGQARIKVFIIEGRPVLARGGETAYVPSGSRGKGQGLLKLLGIRNFRSLWPEWLHKKKRHQNYFLLPPPASLSLSISFLGGGIPECKIYYYLTPFPFLVRLSHFFICHYVTGCFIFRGKHFRAGITVLMTASSRYFVFKPFEKGLALCGKKIWRTISQECYVLCGLREVEHFCFWGLLV